MKSKLSVFVHYLHIIITYESERCNGDTFHHVREPGKIHFLFTVCGRRTWSILVLIRRQTEVREETEGVRDDKEPEWDRTYDGWRKRATDSRSNIKREEGVKRFFLKMERRIKAAEGAGLDVFLGAVRLTAVIHRDGAQSTSPAHSHRESDRWKSTGWKQSETHSVVWSSGVSQRFALHSLSHSDFRLNI